MFSWRNKKNIVTFELKESILSRAVIIPYLHFWNYLTKAEYPHLIYTAGSQSVQFNILIL